MAVFPRRALPGFALAAALPRIAGAGGIAKLREAGARVGLLIGSSSEVDFITTPSYGALIDGNCDLFAPNMSWQRLAPDPAAALTAVDPDIAAALEAGLKLTGYHLLWHQRLPDWFAPLKQRDAERAIRNHIDRLAAAFGGTTFSWNVINEAIRPQDGRPDGLRASPLSQLFGPAIFDLAFDAAAAAAPRVLRVYNDYDLELADAGDAARRAALLRLLDGSLRRSVPVQAIGLQCHLRSRNFDRFDPVIFRRFLADLAARGLDILITELDVQDSVTGDIATRDRQIAAIYRRFLAAALDEPRVRALVFWGLSDRYSWWNDPTRPTFNRGDGTLGRSLLFDEELRPKPSLTAVLDAIGAAPERAAFRN